MNLDTSLAPRFVIFHYFIKWFIETFGKTSYFIGIIGGVLAFCAYAIHKNAKSEEWDRVIMIVIFGFILVGGLLGIGFDISTGHALDPLSY